MLSSHSPILSKPIGVSILVEPRRPGQGIIRVDMCHLRIDPPILVGNLRIGRGGLFGCRRGWIGQKRRQWYWALPRNDFRFYQSGQSLFQLSRTIRTIRNQTFASGYATGFQRHSASCFDDGQFGGVARCHGTTQRFGPVHLSHDGRVIGSL